MRGLEVHLHREASHWFFRSDSMAVRSGFRMRHGPAQVSWPLHQSDYPHGEAHFPDTAQIVLDWPIWKDLGGSVLQQHMAGNAERFLRMT